MAARARQYEAFISYSHAADGALAAQLQRSLNRIARPSYKWWQWWPPRVFRDQTNLAAVGDLTEEIQRALGSSDNLVLLASPLAAASPWVDKEAATWRATKPPGRLFLALTEGALEWDDARGDFDPARTTSLPPSLRGAFDAEPLWVDFTGVREDRPFARDPLFLDGAAGLAAAIRGVEKDALIGEDVRQRRRARQLAGGAITTVALLAIAATIAAIFALIQRDRANDRARLALSRQYAAQSVAALDVDPERSLVLAARAATTAPTDEADGALRRALRTSRLRSLVDAGAAVDDVAAAADAPVVAGGLGNGDVRVWRTDSTSEPRTFRVGGGKVLDVGVSRDGGRVLGVSPSRAVVWSDGDELARIGTARVLSGALSPDGTIAATGHHGGTVRLWRVESGRLLRELRPPGPPAAVTAVAFSGDGSRLAAASGRRAVVWDLRGTAAPVVRAHESDVATVAFSPDGRRLATGDNDGVVRVWSLRAPRASVLVGHDGKVTSVAFSPDGRSLVTGGVDETARIWDVRTGRETAELRGHNGLVLGVAFDPSGKKVVTGADRSIRTWAVAADPVRVVLDTKNGLRVNDVAFDDSGRRLVTAGNDRKVRLWRTSGRPVDVITHGAGPKDWVESARFDSTGRLVVSGGDDGVVRIWDASSGRPRGTLGRPGDREVFDVAFSPDGSLVLAGGAGGTARLWRWRAGEVAAELRTPAERVNGVAFSPDGTLARRRRRRRGPDLARRLVRPPGHRSARPERRRGERGLERRVLARRAARRRGNWSGAWTVWDVPTRQLVARAKGHVDTVSDVAFSPDGAYLRNRRLGRRSEGLDDARRRTRHLDANDRSLARGRRVRAARTAVAVAGDGGRATVFSCEECRPLEALVCVAAERASRRPCAAGSGEVFADVRLTAPRGRSYCSKEGLPSEGARTLPSVAVARLIVFAFGARSSARGVATAGEARVDRRAAPRRRRRSSSS